MNILFLCTDNGSLSQMAEGIARQFLHGRAEIRSAGTTPAREVHSWAIAALRERGIDISQYKPKSVHDLDPSFVMGINFIIFIGQEVKSPLATSQAKLIHWKIPSPEGGGRKSFRMAREKLRKELESFATREIASIITSSG